MKIFIKGGKSEVSSGKIWSKKTGTCLGGLTSKEYVDKTTALIACAKRSDCKGIVLKPTGVYVIATQTKLIIKIGYVSWLVGRLVSIIYLII